MKTKDRKIAAAVAARIAFLKKVTDFAMMIARERGEMLKNSVHRFHTHSIHRLPDFGDFTFYTDLGHSEMGGNQVKIWYHPGRKYADYAKGGFEQNIALDISWGINVEEPTHMVFSDNPDWQREIPKVIRCWKSIAAKIDAESKRMEQKNLARVEEAQRNFAIAEQARRLQIT